MSFFINTLFIITNFVHTYFSVVSLLFFFLPNHYQCLRSKYDHAYLSEADWQKSIQSHYTFFQIHEPEELKYTYKVQEASFSPQFNETWKAIPLVPVNPPCGCEYPKNSEEIEGRIGLVERGECSFVSKSIRLQEAGAQAVIIMDDSRDNDDLYISMVSDNTDREVKIPVAFLLGKNGYMIKTTMAQLGLEHVHIDIPINISRISPYDLNQPKWLIW